MRAISAFSSSGRSAFFCVDDGAGAFDGFVEQVAQRDVFARARAHDLAVLAEDRAEGNVRQRHRVTHAPHDGVDLLEVQRLRRRRRRTRACPRGIR